jgi:hypothetical protein
MKKYEYKFLVSKTKLGFDFEKKCASLEKEWNELGQQGWKFCSWGNGVAIFMREIDE